MSDTVKKYFEDKEETCNYSGLRSTSSYQAKYIFLLDFTDGKVYRYDISSLCNEENKWNPDSESCEAFLYGAGHKVNDCEWMVTSTKDITPGNTL
tara:strand:- start:3081 stop:3365 length:285 start_codon:yes stop_codon:yes gene_type:complete